MAKYIVIRKCQECPHCEQERTAGAGYALDFLCALKSKKLIKGYIEYEKDEPNTIPKWCPLPEMKE